MELGTQKFIRENGLPALSDQFHIIARRHEKWPNLVHLKYNQIDSPMSERIVQECRGLILDESKDWAVVSYPYDKFFNHGEGHAAEIDWGTSRVYEKLDGSLMVLYPYDGEWQVASSGTPDAGGPAHGCGMTFAQLFWKVWKQLGYVVPRHTEMNCCMMFELLTPHNRIIVPHVKSRIVLHGVRFLETGKEEPPEPIATMMGWECVKSFSLGCIGDCLEAAKVLNPMESEGYVVRDAEFRRIKVKSPQYVALAHMKESMSVRQLLEIIRLGESDEFLSYFPEWRAAYEGVRERFDGLCADLSRDYERIRDIPVQKDFAVEAMKTRFASPLFAIRAGKCQSVREFLAACTMAAVERAVGFTNEELVGLLDCGGPVASN